MPIKLTPAPMPGWMRIKSRLTKQQVRDLNALPGCKVSQAGGTIPANVLPLLPGYGLSAPDELDYRDADIWDDRLFPYQGEDVTEIYYTRRFMLNHEMGVGKTPPTCVALREINELPILIVCPTIARRVWEDHLGEWWQDHPDIAVIAEGKKAGDAATAPIVITSFGLVHTIPERKWAALVIDEAHYLKNDKSRRTKAVRAIKNHRRQTRILLTGTPVANEPIDLWAQSDLLIPGQFGTLWEFKQRYMNERANSHTLSGVEYYGIREDRAEELATRLRTFSRRKLKSDPDVQAMLPRIKIETVRVKPKKLDIRALLEDIGRADVHRRKVRDSILKASTSEKLEHAVKMVEEAQASGCTHISVLTHMRSTAHELAERLGGKCITGEMTEKKRHKILDELRESSTGILVATMHSITTGLSLNEYTEVVYAELDYKPHEVAQSMARYHRVSGSRPVRVRVLVLEGTLEEKIAEALKKKLADIGMTVGVGTVDGGLEDALDDDDTDFFEQMQSVAASMLDSGGYL